MKMKAKKENLKKLLVYIIIIALIVVLGCVLRYSAKNRTAQKVFYAMDTTVSIKLWGNAKEISDYCDAVEELDGLLDCYDEESEIFKLNRDGKADISKKTAEVLGIAKALSEKYPLCDITAGELIDLWDVNGEGYLPGEEEIEKVLGGIGIGGLSVSGQSAVLENGKINLGCMAKGYACDALKEKFEENGEECAVVSFGSSSLLFGKKPDGERFTLSVKDPFDSDGVIGTLETDECFVSTSGGYERFFEENGVRYSHIFDLNTGFPAETDLLSVTVIGKSGAETDFFSTYIYICGTKGLDEFLDSSEFKIIAVDENRNVYVSKELKKDFKLENSGFKLVE